MTETTRPTALQPGVLSVVVAVHDVAPWLPGCVESMLRQDAEDVQIVIVDDGSTDGSGEIARAAAARHRHITYLGGENAGVSVARNRGVEHSTGEYLAFVDGDDQVAPGAWSSMRETLQRSGSDLVVGAAVRSRGDRRAMPRVMRRNHHVERLGIRLEDQPLLLADVFAWNKVFRRSFWDEVDLRWAPGMLYQDQPTLTRAFLRAGRIDVLTDVVYEWLVRPDGTSATQQRHTVVNLRDRVATKRMTLDLVRDHGEERLHRLMLRRILPQDMWLYFRAVPGCTTAYWDLLVEAVREFWGLHSIPFEETALPPRHRLMGCLVAQDRREDAVELLSHLSAHPGGLVDPQGRYEHPWVGDPRLPAFSGPMCTGLELEAVRRRTRGLG